ncbi:MAG: hypothetical protein KF789_07440 [Bdellovibrionaceae bacterium]|nr:hypothetical protein [Pseudobdellovibrionaceae bacterium]
MQNFFDEEATLGCARSARNEAITFAVDAADKSALITGGASDALLSPTFLAGNKAAKAIRAFPGDPARTLAADARVISVLASVARSGAIVWEGEAS